MTSIALYAGPRLSRCFAFLTHELDSRGDLSDRDRDVVRVLRQYVSATLILLNNVDTLYLSGPKIIALVTTLLTTVEEGMAHGPESARVACIKTAGSIRDILAILSERAMRASDQKLALDIMPFLLEYSATKTAFPFEQPLAPV